MSQDSQHSNPSFDSEEDLLDWIEYGAQDDDELRQVLRYLVFLNANAVQKAIRYVQRGHQQKQRRQRREMGMESKQQPPSQDQHPHQHRQYLPPQQGQTQSEIKVANEAKDNPNNHSNIIEGWRVEPGTAIGKMTPSASKKPPQQQLLVLCTSRPASKKEGEDQDNAMKVCREAMILPYIILKESKPALAHELMQISKLSYYPQFFWKTNHNDTLRHQQEDNLHDDNSVTTFLGDYDVVHRLHLQGQFHSKLLQPDRPGPTAVPVSPTSPTIIEKVSKGNDSPGNRQHLDSIFQSSPPLQNRHPQRVSSSSASLASSSSSSSFHHETGLNQPLLKPGALNSNEITTVSDSSNPSEMTPQQEHEQPEAAVVTLASVPHASLPATATTHAPTSWVPLPTASPDVAVPESMSPTAPEPNETFAPAPNQSQSGLSTDTIVSRFTAPSKPRPSGHVEEPDDLSYSSSTQPLASSPGLSGPATPIRSTTSAKSCVTNQFPQRKPSTSPGSTQVAPPSSNHLEATSPEKQPSEGIPVSESRTEDTENEPPLLPSPRPPSPLEACVDTNSTCSNATTTTTATYKWKNTTTATVPEALQSPLQPALGTPSYISGNATNASAATSTDPQFGKSQKVHPQSSVTISSTTNSTQRWAKATHTASLVPQADPDPPFLSALPSVMDTRSSSSNTSNMTKKWTNTVKAASSEEKMVLPAPKQSSDRIMHQYPKGGACYLVYDAVKSELNIYYSEVPVDGSVGVWTTPHIKAFKEAQGLGQSEMIGNCASGVHDPQQYCYGWCQFITAARSMEATVMVLDVGVPVDFYLYLDGNTELVQGGNFETETADAVACLPKNAEFAMNLTGKTWSKAAKKLGSAAVFRPLSARDRTDVPMSSSNHQHHVPDTPSTTGTPATPMTSLSDDPSRLRHLHSPPSSPLLLAASSVSASPLATLIAGPPSLALPDPVAMGSRGFLSAMHAPNPPGGACYLVYETDSSGRLVEHCSKTPVPDAIGRWVPTGSKAMPGFKFTQNLGRNVLIGNCSAGVQGRKNYSSGWCQFVRSARVMKAEVMLWDPVAKGLMVDVYLYQDDLRPTHQTVKLLPGVAHSVEKTLAVACIPKNTPFYEGMCVDILKWLADGSNYGASSRF